MSNFISIKNLYKIFGKNSYDTLQYVKKGMSKDELLEKENCVLGLNNINLNIPKGKIQVVMGLSGSGKSTLIRHLNRLIEPTSGKIMINKKDVLSLTQDELLKFRQKNMSMVFQKFALFPHKTIIQNIGYGLTIQSYPKKLWNEKTSKWIERVGLEGYEDHYPSQLSGGMQQRVGLARALATDAEILLMDEAFSALDPLIRSDMQDILLDLQSELSKTIVFITHDLDEALKIGDNIAILRDGKIIQASNPQNIILHPADDYVKDFIKDINRARVIKVNSIMNKNKIVTTKNISVNENMILENVLQKFVNKPSSTILVKDKNNKIVGNITIRDILNSIQKPTSKNNSKYT